MTPERWQQIKVVFEAVDSAPPAGRAALLDQLCQGDAALRQEVEKLLTDSGDGTYIRGLVEEAAGAVPAGSHDLTGTTLASYRVIRLIGSGGMGEVYAAEDSRLGRQVALKVLPALHARDAERIRRFQQEARAVSALNHPNIVTVYDFGQANGLYYLATELVEGQTLRSLMKNGAPSVSDSVKIATQIASALVAAHHAGIVHRDIKPENVMVRPDEYVKVLDFGLAKLREPATAPAPPTSLTLSGTVMGTTAYMSPEQARSLPIDGRSDIFSLGVVLYEMLTGRAPFAGPTGADRVAALLHHEPEPASRITPGIPKGFSDLLERCLRKDPGQRYQTSEELLAGLRKIQQAGSPGRTARASGLIRWLAGVGAVALVAVLAFWLLGHRESPWYRNTRLTVISNGDYPGYGGGTISPSGRYLLITQKLPDRQEAIGLRLLSSDKVVEVLPPSHFKHYAIGISPDEEYLYYTQYVYGEPESSSTLYRIPLLGGEPQKLVLDAQNLGISRDGKRIAFVRRKQGGYVLISAAADGTDQRELMVSDRTWPFYTFCWSPDGKEVFYIEGSQTAEGRVYSLRSVKSDGSSHKLIANLGMVLVVALAALPDGSGLVANALDRELKIFQIYRISPTGLLSRITHDVTNYSWLSITLDGKVIATNQTTQPAETWIVDAQDPGAARMLSDSTRKLSDTIWARNGDIVTLLNGRLWTISAGTGKKYQLPVPGSQWEMEPVACPDRDDIVFVAHPEGKLNVWRILPDGTGLKQLTFGASDHSPQCLPGGIASYESQGAVKPQQMQVSLDGGTPAPLTDPTLIQGLSPDGRWKLVSFSDPKTHESREAVQTRDGSKTLFTFASSGMAVWAPNGKGIAHTKDDSPDIWYQPVDGGAVRTLTHFEGKRVSTFAWSPDGSHLVCNVGQTATQTVLIQDVR